MKLVNLKYFDVIQVSAEYPETLVIENPKLLRNMIEDLLYQVQSDEGEFFLSDTRQKPLALSKNTMLITDIFHFDSSIKPIKTKIINLINNEYSEIDGKEQLMEMLNNIGIDICNSFPYQLTFKSNLTFSDVVKMLDFSLDITEGEFWDRFVEFTSACFDLLDYRLLVTINLKDYTTQEEYEELVKALSYRNIPMLMIESRQHENLDKDINHLRIIDNDLCVL